MNETAIGRRIKTLLAHLQLPNPFRPENIGNDEVHASFPSVQREQGELSKAIEPFDLNQDELNDIYAHGDVWVQKIKRQLLPPKVLFAGVGVLSREFGALCLTYGLHRPLPPDPAPAHPAFSLSGRRGAV